MKNFICLSLVLLATVAAAQDYPRAEVFGGYSYLHTSFAGTGLSHPAGGSGSVTVNLNDWFGIAGDFGGYHHAAGGGACGECSVGSTIVSYLFGPKVAYRRNAAFTPYAQALFGGVHQTVHIGGNTNSGNGFAMAMGGGFDLKTGRHLAIRLVQIDYLLTKFSNDVSNRQNNVRVSTGIVFRWP
jgi:outer membrane immunogenic protein